MANAQSFYPRIPAVVQAQRLTFQQEIFEYYGCMFGYKLKVDLDQPGVDVWVTHEKNEGGIVYRMLVRSGFSKDAVVAHLARADALAETFNNVAILEQKGVAEVPGRLNLPAHHQQEARHWEDERVYQVTLD